MKLHELLSVLDDDTMCTLMVRWDLVNNHTLTGDISDLKMMLPENILRLATINNASLEMRNNPLCDGTHQQLVVIASMPTYDQEDS